MSALASYGADDVAPILHDRGLGALWPLALGSDSSEAEHVSDLLRSDLLVAAEDVGLGAVLERELIDLHLCENEAVSVTGVCGIPSGRR